MGIKTTQNFTLISKMLRKCEKVANKKVAGKYSVQNWSLPFSLLLTCKRFLENNFSCIPVHIFPLFPQIWNRRIFDTVLICKNRNQKNFGFFKYICAYFLELVECKFARNGLPIEQHLTNILKNIIWHLFAGESHHDVKITVNFWTVFQVPIT